MLSIAGVAFESVVEIAGRVAACIWHRTRSRRLQQSMEGRYLQSVIQGYERWADVYLETQGARERAGPALADDITIHPAMYGLLDREEGAEPAGPSVGAQRDSRVRVGLSGIVDELQQFVLLGEPGSGKTSHLQWFALKAARLGAYGREGECTLPVLIDLGGYRGPQGVVDFLKGCLRDEHGLAGAYLAENLTEYLEEGRLLFLLDGLNEMPADGYRQRVDRLRRFADANTPNKFVFSCRDLDYEYRFGWPRVVIAPLEEAEVEEFVARYLPETGSRLMEDLRRGDRALLELARNPFILRMMILIHQRSGALPPARGRLLSEFVDCLLAREKKDDAWPQTREAAAFKGAMAQLAFLMIEDGKVGSTVDKDWVDNALGSVRSRAPGAPTFAVADLVKLGADASLLEISRARDRIRYYHELVQEYFGAVALRERWEVGDDLGPYLDDCWWEATIELVCGFANEPEQLVSAILARLGPERGTLLAGACCVEAASFLPRDTVDQVLLALDRLCRLGLGPLGIRAMDVMAQIDYGWIEDRALEPDDEAYAAPEVQVVELLAAGHVSIAGVYMGPLAFATRDRAWDPRAYAASIVRLQGSSRVAEVVLGVLDRSSPGTSHYFQAVAALADLAPREASDALATVLRNGHGRARQDAARGLGKIGDVANEALLTRTVMAPAEGLDLRRECAVALRMMLGAEYVEELAQSSQDTEVMGIVQSALAPPWPATQRASADDDHGRGTQTSELMDLDPEHLLQRLLNPPDDQPYLWVPYELAATLARKADEGFIPDLEGALNLFATVPPSAHYDHKAKEALWWVIDAIREKRRRRGRPPKLSPWPRDWSAFRASPR